MKSLLKSIPSELGRRRVMQGIAAMSLGVQASSYMPELNASESTAGKRKVIRLIVKGGMSHIDSFDPKPQSPEIFGGTKTIKTSHGDTISAYFPEMAKRMHKVTLIRSMTSSEGDHQRGQYLLQSAYNQIGTIKHPTLGSWIQRLSGTQNEALPSSINIGRNLGSGFLGTNFDPFTIKNAKDPLNGLLMDQPTSEENIQFLKLMSKLRIDFHKKFRFKNTDAYKNFYNDSIRFMQSEDLVAFDMKQEDKKTLQKYNIPNGEKLLLARRLNEANVQYIGVNLGGSWDNHGSLWVEDNFPNSARALDKSIAVFLDDLEARGVLKDTIVTVNSEFGRTPKINRDKGRDHHRKAFSSLIFGAGVKQGLVYGKTDDRADSVVENPVEFPDLTATLASLLHLNIEKEVFSPDNRPFTIARGGKPVKDIMI